MSGRGSESVEYRHFSPLRSLDRIVFSVDCTLADGKHIFEHVIAHIEDGMIARQFDVEAYDDENV